LARPKTPDIVKKNLPSANSSGIGFWVWRGQKLQALVKGICRSKTPGNSSDNYVYLPITPGIEKTMAKGR